MTALGIKLATGVSRVLEVKKGTPLGIMIVKS